MYKHKEEIKIKNPFRFPDSIANFNYEVLNETEL
jgi:hypothetical protein